jgi:hypothetical protein
MSQIVRGAVRYATLALALSAVICLPVAAPRLSAGAQSSFIGFPCDSDAALTCVMRHLDGVRGVAFGPDGALYVAEAGSGGEGPCIRQSGVQVCYGPTGAITRLFGEVSERILRGLPSIAINDPMLRRLTGQAANGPTDIAFRTAVDVDDDGTTEGDDSNVMYVTIGLRNDPTLRSLLGDAGQGFGRLARVAPNRKLRFIADLGDYEIEANPDGGVIDTNPFGVLAESGSRLVVDAGANALLRVFANGHGPVSTVATFPSRAQGRATDAVPTSVAVGPDGAYYVSELTGIPFATWNAGIYRVVPGESPTMYADGFRMIIDIAFDAEWNLYVLQYATVTGTLFGRSGVLTRLAPDGTRATILSGLRTPTSVAVGPDGYLYVSNVGNFPGIGEVVRVAPPSQ